MRIFFLNNKKGILFIFQFKTWVWFNLPSTSSNEKEDHFIKSSNLVDELTDISYFQIYWFSQRSDVTLLALKNHTKISQSFEFINCPYLHYNKGKSGKSDSTQTELKYQNWISEMQIWWSDQNKRNWFNNLAFHMFSKIFSAITNYDISFLCPFR